MSVSTKNAQGFPTSRIVDLKEINQEGFIFCTNMDSAKGIDIERDHKVGLTFWWDEVGRQIRVLGVANRIKDEKADYYWASRTQEAKITSLCLQTKPTADFRTSSP